MTGIDQKVRDLLKVPETKLNQAQYRVDYLVAMMEFKGEHPVRQMVSADYVAIWIANYLIKNYRYKQK